MWLREVSTKELTHSDWYVVGTERGFSVRGGEGYEGLEFQSELLFDLVEDPSGGGVGCVRITRPVGSKPGAFVHFDVDESWALIAMIEACYLRDRLNPLAFRAAHREEDPNWPDGPPP